MSLLSAAEGGLLSRCRQLLAAGSDVGERNERGSTPLLDEFAQMNIFKWTESGDS